MRAPIFLAALEAASVQGAGGALTQRMKLQQVALKGFPDDFQIHLEIPMRHGVAHLVGNGQRQFRMGSGERGVEHLDVAAGFANDL